MWRRRKCGRKTGRIINVKEEQKKDKKEKEREEDDTEEEGERFS
jgi:hypothetical protein